MTANSHSHHSAFREKVIEHVFLGDLLRQLWLCAVNSVEVLKPEVDDGGYDLVLGCGNILRHVQLKASTRTGHRQYVDIHQSLRSKPSACVIWIFFDEPMLRLGPYLWFGGKPGEAMTDIAHLPVAVNPRSKTERPALRRVRRSRFERLANMDELLERLFGTLPPASP